MLQRTTGLAITTWYLSQPQTAKQTHKVHACDHECVCWGGGEDTGSDQRQGVPFGTLVLFTSKTVVPTPLSPPCLHAGLSLEEWDSGCLQEVRAWVFSGQQGLWLQRKLRDYLLPGFQITAKVVPASYLCQIRAHLLRLCMSDSDSNLLLLFFITSKQDPLAYVPGIETKSWLKLITCSNGALEIKARGWGWATLFQEPDRHLPSSTIFTLPFPLFAQMIPYCNIVLLLHLQSDAKGNSHLFIKT